MEDHDLKKLSRLLELKATREILLSVHEGKNQYKHFRAFGCSATINERTRQLINLGIIEQNLIRDCKRREYYTLTERGKRIVEQMERKAEDDEDES